MRLDGKVVIVTGADRGRLGHGARQGAGAGKAAG